MSRPTNSRSLVALGVFGLLGFVAVLVIFLWSRGEEPDRDEGSRAEPSQRVARRVHGVPAQPEERPARVVGDVQLAESDSSGTARVCATPRAPSGHVLLARVACTKPEAGRYSFELSPGAYRMSASARGHLPVAQDVTLSADDLEVSFELASGGAVIAGRVLDLAGGVIDGAMVQSGDGFAVSDEEGRFELWTRAGETSVTAWSPGYVPARTTQWAPVETLELHLLMASSISGRVLGLDGAPAAGVELSVLDGALTESDERGEFKLAPLRPGRYSVLARADGARGRAEHSVLLGLGEHATGVEITLRPATRVRGVIVDEDDRPFCTSGQVLLSPETPGIEALESVISPTSEAEFRAAAPGRYYAHARCDEPNVKFSVPNVIVEREPQTLRWVAPSGATVRGCVTRHAEKLMGARVALDGAEENPPVHRVTQLDADGCFAFSRIPPGRYRVGPDPYGEHTATLVERRFELERHDVEIALNLAEVATLTGTIVDRDGAALVGYALKLEAQGQRRAKLERVTTAAGEFRFDVVPAGALQVAVRDGDGRGAEIEGAFPGAPTLTLRDGETRTLRVTLPRGDGRIAGTVRGSGDTALSDVFVTGAREGDGGARGSASDARLLGVAGGHTVLCDVDGSFELDHLTDGTYTIIAFERGGREVSRGGVRVGDSVELVLEDEAVLRGTASLPGGEAPERFELLARPASPGAGVQEAFERTEGRWRIEGLNAGEFVVSATAEGGFAAVQRVTTMAGEVTTLDLQLSAPATISGRLVDAGSGQPVAGIKVWAGDALARSDERGAFRLEGVPVTETSLFAWNGAGAGHQMARLRLALASGEDVDIGVIELSRVGAP